MRILHTGDIHLGDLAGPTKDGENLRRLDTIGCMKAIVEDAQSIKPEVSIIAGGAFYPAGTEEMQGHRTSFRLSFSMIDAACAREGVMRLGELARQMMLETA